MAQDYRNKPEASGGVLSSRSESQSLGVYWTCTQPSPLPKSSVYQESQDITVSMLALKEVAWEGGSSWKALVDYGIAEQLCLAAINLEMKFPENLSTTNQQRPAARETVRLSVHSLGFHNCRQSMFPLDGVVLSHPCGDSLYGCSSPGESSFVERSKFHSVYKALLDSIDESGELECRSRSVCLTHPYGTLVLRCGGTPREASSRDQHTCLSVQCLLGS